MKILILLLVFGFLLFFHKVGDRDLWAPDEDEYAQMSREMIRFDNWAFPTVNGQPWAIKPVLYNWLIALVSLPWGDVDEFRARIFSSLAALGTFLATFYLGRRAFSPLAGLLSAAVLGTSVLFLQYARWSQTNMLSTFFMMFTVFLFYRGYTDPFKRRLSYLLMYASVGLGVLTMGPVNLIMPGMVIFFYLIVMKDFRHLRELRLGWGILIFLAITCPWYILVSLKEGYGFDLLIKTNISRYFDTWTHDQPFYYYLLDLPWAFAPWSLFLPGALLLAFSKRTRDDRPALKFLLVWVISLFLFFSFSQAKRPQYILAIYPALALLVGYLGDKAINFRQEKYYQKLVTIPSLIFLGILTLATIGLPVFAGIFFKPWFLAAFGVSVITGSFAVLLWLAWRKNQARQLLFLPAVFMLILTLYSVHVLIPKMEYYKSPKPFCQQIVANLKKGGQWAMYRFYRAAYVYYTDSFCTVLKNEPELEAFLNQPTLSMVVLKDRHYQLLGDSLKDKTYLLAKRQIGHRRMVLIANQKPS
ncbi:MAG: glycosyltransferase family 39 protein [Deltaproteobacteria bacterium]|nr:glycosyltransferase family 39 protein [Deltaproteobacteria bacterium]